MANALKSNSDGSKIKSKGGVMDLLFNIDSLTGGELPYDLLKKIFFIAGLIMVYIYYTMMAESKIHQIEKVKMDLEEIRADYTTQKAEYMKVSKQSNLEETLKRYQIGVSTIPPTKVIIQVKKDQ
jgi:Tfp pilus assembly protein PilO